jgi:hypothetical protein
MSSAGGRRPALERKMREEMRGCGVADTS